MLHRLIDRLVRRAEEGVLPDRLTNGQLGRSTTEPPPGSTRRVQRAKTMGTLLKSITSGIIVAIVVTMMLRALGLTSAPILASAGILGVALGFGSQTLVKDFLSGIFMIFEDQYGVGDVVDMGEAVRHGRGREPARHPAARHQRHRLVRPQRRDLPRRQHEPELGPHGARRPGQLRARTSPTYAGSSPTSSTTCGRTTTTTA